MVSNLRARVTIFVLLLVIILPNIALAAPENPIIFCTQPPNPTDFGTVNATFGNHLATLYSTPRGGDLYIRYPDGTLKNLTSAAGFGMTGLQGAQAIAVRDPAVHWDGTKVIFSMVIGAPTQQYQYNNYRWQLYEITGLGKDDTPIITAVANQPQIYNNVMPAYASDDKIIFVTDRPRNGAAHLYPQRDEYESAPTNTGLWKLDPSNGELQILDHAPSGNFHPIVDSFGRIIFTRWDHLQRDQQNIYSQPYFDAFDYSDESADAARSSENIEVFPEIRDQDEPGYNSGINLYTINHFFPWQMNQDGTEHETLNHIGRHELHSYIERTFNDDDNVEEFYGQYSRFNQNSILNLFHIKEDPTQAGIYYGVDAPEFGTHAAGQIVSINGAPSISPDQMQVTYVTHPDTSGTSDSPSANHSGLYRDPLVLTNGELVAVHTSETRQDSNVGTGAAPQSRYDFKLKSLKQSGSYFVSNALLAGDIRKTVSYWDPDKMVSYDNVSLWQLQPVELRARTLPSSKTSSLEEPEQSIFSNAGISPEELKEYLTENNLALVVSRDLTSRDKNDRQQPQNLRVAGSVTKNAPKSGKIYEIAHVQFFQGDQVRGYGGADDPDDGRRVLPRHMHVASNPENSGGPQASVRIAADGSMAAFVPARRAMTWQLTDSGGNAVVRERYWVTFQPGEIRVCASCHGLNTVDQSGNTKPTNAPQALSELLDFWKGIPKEDPTFNLKLGEGKKRLNARSQFQLNIDGTSSNAGSKNLSLYLKAGRTDCGSIKSFTTNDSGDYILTATAPALHKKMKLTFSLVRGSKVISSLDVPLKRGKQKRTARKSQNACEAVKAGLE